MAAERTKPNEGIAFDLMVHRIHTGVNLPAMGRSYTIIGFGGSQNDFTTVRYPAMTPSASVHDTANCEMCHNAGTENNLPVGLNAVVDPQGPIPSDQATAAACTACHATLPTASHALANTTALGESCGACHGPSADYNTLGLDYSVSKVHAQY